LLPPDTQGRSTAKEEAERAMRPDQRRRLELRDFLVAVRSRLTPVDVGLPEASRRRRIAGLSQTDVAELLGTSTEWYRWFEVGREVRVSERFLERLADALRLAPLDRVTLYRLALPGLYVAQSHLGGVSRASDCGIDAASLPILPAALSVPIGPEADLESAARSFASAREVFLTGKGHDPPVARPRVLRSWQRSMALGIDAAQQVAPCAVSSDAELKERREVNERLLRSANQIVRSLADSLTDTGYAVVLTDADGCLLSFDGDSEIRRHALRRGFEPGRDWSERAAGTNAIGIALSDGRPFQLMSGEHFCEGWADYVCTAAPIRHPSTSELVGVLDITALYGLTRPQLLGLVMQSSCEIEEALNELN
jgi:transcriptional regulator with XRE-family HTH domain